MSDQWAVLVPQGKDVTVYGPMEAVEAQAFARFMTKEVDPCEIRKLCSPLRETLAWYEQEMARNDCTHGPGCPVHIAGVSCQTWTCTHVDGCPVHPDVKALHNSDAKGTTA